MSDARCCDICDKFYKPEQFNRNNKYKNGRPIFRIELFTWGMSSVMDICPTCSEKLRDFLGRERTCLK